MKYDAQHETTLYGMVKMMGRIYIERVSSPFILFPFPEHAIRCI